MSKVKVGVAGYGVIGNRLAGGVALQEDMELVGVADVAPTLPVRALKERGMPFKLFAAVDGAEKALGEAPVRSSHSWFRLPVDRVFSSRGFGTVITGTAWSGAVRVGDRLHILPEGREVRVRKVEVFHDEVEEARAGQEIEQAQQRDHKFVTEFLIEQE